MIILIVLMIIFREEKKDMSTLIKKEFMKASGLFLQTCAMVKASISLVEDPYTRATGKMIWLVARVDLYTVTKMSMKVTGLMTSKRVTALTNMLTEHFIKDNGKMIFSMVKDMRLGMISLSTTDSMKKAKSTEKVNWFGLMEATMRVISSLTTLKEKEFTCGLMAVLTAVNGRITRWKARACLLGTMIEGMKDLTSQTRKKAMVLWSGLTVADTRAGGRTTRKMVKVKKLLLAVESRKVNGLMANSKNLILKKQPNNDQLN